MLEKILGQLLSQAAKTHGKTIYRPLTNGLMISVREDNDVFTMALSRRNVLPSMREYETIMAHMPAGYVLINKPDLFPFHILTSQDGYHNHLIIKIGRQHDNSDCQL